MFLLSDYDYHLPEERIAQTPVVRRDQSRLLCLEREKGRISHHTFADICDLLLPSDVLVINNTKVIPARLFGRKETGGKAEFLMLGNTRQTADDAQQEAVVYHCLIKAARRLKNGARVFFDKGLTARILGFQNGVYAVRFDCEGELDVLLEQIGYMPLPPYISRPEGEAPPCNDQNTYQTVYASQKGAVAAPTAGLHFTEAVLQRLKARGILIVAITLHVGYGTFLPVRVTDIRDHQIHSEWYAISDEAAKTINQARSDGRRIVAVGTTSVRTLEYASDDNGYLSAGADHCDLFIYPGYTFKLVDAMITNFHLPRSTLLMLVSAFAGHENIQQAYREAIRHDYRFYSYGDAMLMT
jgi:S-adenosylmethionine:tRNA ribosyltransferase-isomerase